MLRRRVAMSYLCGVASSFEDADMYDGRSVRAHAERCKMQIDMTMEWLRLVGSLKS